MKRKEFLKNTGIILASGMTIGFSHFEEAKAAGQQSVMTTKEPKPFPIYDLHVHSSQVQTPRQIVEKAEKNGIQMCGIILNPGRTDDSLLRFINDVKDLPCYMALQPMQMGWSAYLSKELVEQVDYVIMDAQTVPNSNKYGDTAMVWRHDCYITDAEEFMKINMKHYLAVINNPEPLNIFGWPLYLPPAIAPLYLRLWTKERMEQIIEAVRNRGIALEINDLARTPHAEFILMAKKAGVKFVFGSDARDHRTFRLDYCKQIASLCGLNEDDFYIPVRKKR
jgi:histidinol phosphatase-like PHP family hydrolase